MPNYEYKHDTCNHEWEEWRSIKHCMPTPEDKCPKCGEIGNITLLVSGGSGRGKVELYGDDAIAASKAEGKQIAALARKDEKVYANILGESKYHELQTRLDRRPKRR